MPAELTAAAAEADKARSARADEDERADASYDSADDADAPATDVDLRKVAAAARVRLQHTRTHCAAAGIACKTLTHAFVAVPAIVSAPRRRRRRCRTALITQCEPSTLAQDGVALVCALR
jgi:hypothetical protein